ELVEHDAGGSLERTPLVGIAREPVLDAPARNEQVNALVAILDETLDRERDRCGDRVAAVHDRVLAEQDHLAVADAHRLLLSPFAFALRLGPSALVLDLADDLLRLPNLDYAALDQAIEHLVEDFLRRPGRGHDASGVQRH